MSDGVQSKVVRNHQPCIPRQSDASRTDVKPGNGGSTLRELPKHPNWKARSSAEPIDDPDVELDDLDDLAGLQALLQKFYANGPAAPGTAEALHQQLAWSGILLQHIAPCVAREALRLKRKGLIEHGPDGNFRRCTDWDGKERKGPRERKADKSKARAEKLGKKFRLEKRKRGHTLGTGGFLTTEKHAVNYAASAAGSLGKEIAYGVGDAMAPGMGDVASLLTIPVHAMFIDNVRNTREAINEKAGMGVVLGLRDVQDCLRILRRGDRPSPALMVRWLGFCNDVVAWDKTARIGLAAVKASATQSSSISSSERLSHLLRVKTSGENKGAQIGGWRDCEGAVPLELYAAARAVDYLAGTPAAGYLGPIGVVAGLFFDLPQAGSEKTVAAVSKALASWRQQALREELQTLRAERHDDFALHAKVVASLIGMFGRKKKQARQEEAFSAVRAFYGMTRVVSGALMTASLAVPPLAPVFVPTAGAVGTTGQLVMGTGFALRQYLRWCETHSQKATERDFRHWLAANGGGGIAQQWDALTTCFMDGFSVERSVGDLRDGQDGFAGAHEADYASGENELMALEIAARGIVVHQALKPAEGDSYFMDLLERRLGLSPVSKLFTRACVEDFLYNDQADAAIEFVSGVMRKLLEAPASRATEPARADAFLSTFESARQRAWLRLADDDPREPADVPLDLLEQEFFAPRGDGTAIDKAAFARSMEALRSAWDTKYAKVERTGVYAQMLSLHRHVQARKNSPSRIAVHVERWQDWADGVAFDEGLAGERGKLGEWLTQAAGRPGTTWQAQVKAELRASPQPLERCRALLDDLRQLTGAHPDMPPFVARFASELRLELGSIAADIDRQLDPESCDWAGWIQAWAAFKMPADKASGELDRTTRLVGTLLERLHEGEGSLDERLPNALRGLAKGRDEHALTDGLLDGMELLNKEIHGLSWLQRHVLQRLTQACARSAQKRGVDSPSIASVRERWRGLPEYLLVDTGLTAAHSAVDKELDEASNSPGATWQDQLRNSLLASQVRRQDCEALLANVNLLGNSDLRKSPGASNIVEELKQALQPLAADFRWLDVNAFDAEAWVQAWQEEVAKPARAAGDAFAREQRLVAGLLEQLVACPGKSLAERLPAALGGMEQGGYPREVLVPALRDALTHLRDLPGELPWFQTEMTILLEHALRRVGSH